MKLFPKTILVQSFSAFTRGWEGGHSLSWGIWALPQNASLLRASSKMFTWFPPPDYIHPPSFLRTSGDITKPFPQSLQINWHQCGKFWHCIQIELNVYLARFSYFVIICLICTFTKHYLKIANCDQNTCHLIWLIFISKPGPRQSGQNNNSVQF